MTLTTPSTPFVGVLLACAGNLIISLALNLQKLAHIKADGAEGEEGERNDGEGDGEQPSESTPLTKDKPRPSYLTFKLWWFGLILMVIGEVGNFM